MILLLAIVLSLTANTASAQNPTAEIRTLEGVDVLGTIADVTIDQLKIETGDGAKTVDLDQIETIQFPDSANTQLPEKAAKFQLLDGSSLFADKYKIVGQGK